jgi:NAD+ synthase
MNNPSVSPLNIAPQLTERVLVQFVHNEVTKTGFKKAVLGLSGGIDSALSCYLAVKALGADNVLAIRMPYQASSQGSLDHAQLIIDDLGMPSETVDITPMVEPLFAVSAGISAHRKGNIMSRQRMNILFDRSMAFGGLVIGTSNKTELLLGYGTIFGDLASAVNPIGDLYKTQVRQLSAHMGIPKPILDKAPSADLIPDQTDEDDFGFTYEEVDRLLYLMIDERYTPEEVVKEGFNPEMVKKVQGMVKRSHYKREMPVIPKISGRTINHDFRYLRDWGV